MAEPQNLTLADFNSLKSSGKLIFVDFWAEWCPPCKVMGPIFDELSDDKDFENVTFFKCDVDNEGELAEMFGISSIPTFALVKMSTDDTFDLQRDVIQKFVGAKEKVAFKQDVLNVLKTATVSE